MTKSRSEGLTNTPQSEPDSIHQTSDTSDVPTFRGIITRSQARRLSQNVSSLDVDVHHSPKTKTKADTPLRRQKPKCVNNASGTHTPILKSPVFENMQVLEDKTSHNKLVMKVKKITSATMDLNNSEDLIDIDKIKEEDQLEDVLKDKKIRKTQIDSTSPKKTIVKINEENNLSNVKEEDISYFKMEDHSDLMVKDGNLFDESSETLKVEIQNTHSDSVKTPEQIKHRKNPSEDDNDSKNKVDSNSEATNIQEKKTSRLSLTKKTNIVSNEVKSPKKKTIIEDNSESDEDSDAECRKEIMRSAEKRIIRNISTSESESRNVSQPYSGTNTTIKHGKRLKQNIAMPIFDKDITDSDSAPEVVSFDASRKSAMDILKHTVDSIKKEKQRKKEKRKERLDILRQRKEENLIRLKERKANLEDASCSSSEESVHEKRGLYKTDSLFHGVKGKKTYFSEETVEKKIGGKQGKGLKRLASNLLENLPDQLPTKVKALHKVTLDNQIQSKEGTHDKTKICGNKYKHDIDYIPIKSSASTQFGVVPLNKPKLKTVVQQARDFRQNMLYGEKIRRIPASTLIKQRHKQVILNKNYLK